MTPPASSTAKQAAGAAAPGDRPTHAVHQALRHSEERARGAERWFRAMIDSATDLLAVLDAEGRFTFISGAYQRHLGYQPEEMLGTSCLALVHPDDLPVVTAQLQRALVGGEEEETVTFRYRSKSGEYRWFEVGGRNGLNDPAIRGVVISSRDITEQKRVEEELKLARTAAESAARAKGQFLTNMSHELRTPLNGVLGYVQILHADPALSPNQKECLDAIESCGQQLLSLINDVLDLSKIEAGRLEVTSDTCSLEQVVRTVGNVIRPRAEAKGVLFQIELDPTLPGAISTDELKLRQVLLNLLSNAVKFTSQGHVRLRIAPEHLNPDAQAGGERVRFVVSDTGPGIEPTLLHDIFEPFKQTKVGIREEGTGLGLAISQRLVEALGGRLEVASRLGNGATFFFSIPLVEAETPPLETTTDGAADVEQMSASHHAPIVAGDRQPAVLVVDDRQTNRDILVRLLRLSRFRTHVAANGREALDVLRDRHAQGEPIRLVLMDVRMPVMDGLEATRRIRADAALAATKVVAVTASVFQEARQQIMSAGFDDLIAKPLRIEELFEQLGRHLDVQFTTQQPPPIANGASAGAGAPEGGAPAALSPELARQTAQRVRDALEIGDFTALGALAIELASSGGAAGVVGRDIGRLTRELDFDALRRLAEALTTIATAGESDADAPPPVPPTGGAR